MDNLISFVPEQLIIVVVALYVIGVFLKNTPTIKDWCIPYILLIIGVVGSVFLVGFNATGVLQGIICTGVAVMTNQVAKQTMEKR